MRSFTALFCFVVLGCGSADQPSDPAQDAAPSARFVGAAGGSDGVVATQDAGAALVPDDGPQAGSGTAGTVADGGSAPTIVDPGKPAEKPPASMTAPQPTPTPCVKSTYFTDADGDGHGAGTAIAMCEAPVGYSPIGDDCDDGNPDAWPGQTMFFGLPRGDGSFDYDCDGAEDPWRADIATCSFDPVTGIVTGGTIGWVSECLTSTRYGCEAWAYKAPPGCGEVGSWRSGAGCGLRTPVTQRCR